MIKAAIELHQAGQLKQAKAQYRHILNTEPDHPDALHLYGLACHQLGDHETAVRYIRKAVERVPTQAVLRNNLGDALHRAGQIEEAIEQLKTALDLRPGYAGAHQNLGTIYLETSQHDLALEHCERAAEIEPDRPEAWFNLGLCHLDHVSLDNSAEAFRRALALRPNYMAAVTSLLYVLNLLPDHSPQAVSNETRCVAESAFDQSPIKPVPQQPKPQQLASQLPAPQQPVGEATKRPIRVGYVSGDFCRHAVNYFFEPVLEHHDTSEFEIYCYSDVVHPDDVTKRLQSIAAHWRDISESGDNVLMSQVLADEIDILVDLAGYTRHNRLAAFARQPVSLQVSWLGFPNTSGLDAMNYRVVDCISSPDDQADHGTEKLLKLPEHFACFRPPVHAPVVTDAPCVKNGFVTLASLHKLEKLNPQVIELWAEVLLANPSTQLLLVRDQLDEWQQNRLQKLFAEQGIDNSRLNMKELNSAGQSFFEIFASIDILLDVFPWSGHTLACCSLWMGVPVVSMSGHTHAARMVASVLNSLGKDQWVASDRQDYIQIISDMCNKPSKLASERHELRPIFIESSLRDELTFTRQLEAEFRRILK